MISLINDRHQITDLEGSKNTNSVKYLINIKQQQQQQNVIFTISFAQCSSLESNSGTTLSMICNIDM